jgi:hypothetical protein
MATTGRAGMAASLAVAGSIAGILGTAHELGFLPTQGSDHPASVTSAPSQHHGHHYFRGVVMASPGYAVKVFSTPSLQAPYQGTLANGANVLIKCTVEGDVATFGGKSSSLWNNILSGGYLPDVNVNTGSDQPTMPKC